MDVGLLPGPGGAPSAMPGRPPAAAESGPRGRGAAAAAVAGSDGHLVVGVPAKPARNPTAFAGAHLGVPASPLEAFVSTDVRDYVWPALPAQGAFLLVGWFRVRKKRKRDDASMVARFLFCPFLLLLVRRHGPRLCVSLRSRRLYELQPCCGVQVSGRLTVPVAGGESETKSARARTREKLPPTHSPNTLRPLQTTHTIFHCAGLAHPRPSRAHSAPLALADTAVLDAAAAAHAAAALGNSGGGGGGGVGSDDDSGGGGSGLVFPRPGGGGGGGGGGGPPTTAITADAPHAHLPPPFPGDDDEVDGHTHHHHHHHHLHHAHAHHHSLSGGIAGVGGGAGGSGGALASLLDPDVDLVRSLGFVCFAFCRFVLVRVS